MAVVAPLCLLVVLLVGWWAFTTFSPVESWVMPTPADYLRRCGQLLPQAWFWERMLITAGEALAGSLAGALVALPLAYAIYRVRIVQAAVEPFLGATQAIPAIALAPLLVLWVGYGIAPIVTLCALTVFFPILVSTTVALRQLPKEILEAAELDGADGWTMAASMEIPLAAPGILGGLRNGFTLSITGAIVGEMVMGGTGLGQILTQQRNNLDTAGMFVTLSVLCAMAMTLYVIIYRIEKSQRFRDLRG